MAVSSCYGSVGSGKTYDAICLLLDAMQAGRRTATINVSLFPDRCKSVLVRRGMSYYDADRALGNYERVFTLAKFRTLKNVFLVIDEGHFWFPQNQYAKISLEDILTASMSRKRELDLHLISQLDGQVNQNVRGLSTNAWMAHQLTIEPIHSVLLLYSWFMREMGFPLSQRPVAFFYTRMQDSLGGTSRKRDGSYASEDRRMRFLSPRIASCYNTLEQVSSPILDRMRDEARHEYLLDLIKGKRRPEETCPSCDGSKETVCVRVFTQKLTPDPKKTFVEEIQSCDYSTELYPYSKRFTKMLSHSGIPFDLLEDDCPICNGKGYIFADANHPDYEEAAELAHTLKKHF